MSGTPWCCQVGQCPARKKIAGVVDNKDFGSGSNYVLDRNWATSIGPPIDLALVGVITGASIILLTKAYH